jgi:predicted kinase
MATLYLICGKIASGKTTLARQLAAEHGAAIICEDEWLVRLEANIESFDDFVIQARRLRAAMTPHVVQLLRLGTSVVLDCPANTPNDRAWMRSLFEAAHADHELHVIDAPDDLCKTRLRSRNSRTAGSSSTTRKTRPNIASLRPLGGPHRGNGWRLMNVPGAPASGVDEPQWFGDPRISLCRWPATARLRGNSGRISAWPPASAHARKWCSFFLELPAGHVGNP